MIRVTCAACGSSFNAMAELAGRKGKCPSCKAPLVVPDAGAAPSAPAAAQRAPAAAPAPTPAVAAPTPGGSSRRRSSGGSRGKGRRGGGKDYTVLTALSLVVVVGLGAAAFFMNQDADVDYYALGVDAKIAGNYQQAIDYLTQVPADSRQYTVAQEELAVALERLATENAAGDEKAQRDLHKLVMSLHDKHVYREGEGYKHPNYVPNTRYMLKRAQEFLDRFPDAAQASELRQLMLSYREVASLDKAPTEADVLVELDLRGFGRTPDFAAMVAAVDEYAAASPDKADTIGSLRADLQRRATEYWVATREYLVDQYSLESDDPPWQKIANKIATYMACLEAAPGLTPTAEAVELLRRAEAGG